MKIKIFYCDAYYRGALVAALQHLKVLEEEKLTLGKLLRLTWWSRIAALMPGEVLEIGSDYQGNRVFILSVPLDKELLPKIYNTLASEFEKDGKLILIDALPEEQRFIKWGRWLAIFLGTTTLAHYFFLIGILKLKPSFKLA